MPSFVRTSVASPDEGDHEGRPYETKKEILYTSG